MNAPLVSYCTTSMNRLGFLKMTYDHSIWTQRNLPVEFVLVNYGSVDSIDDWASDKIKNDPMWRVVRYVRVTDRIDSWNPAHAKNIAHFHSTGQIVANLDADYMLAPGYTEFLIQSLAGGDKVFTAPHWDNFHGAIAMKRREMDTLGGHDERFVYGAAWEDSDLVVRAESMKFKKVIYPEHFKFQLRHDDEFKFLNSKLKDKAEIERLHCDMSNARTSDVANGGTYGCAGVEILMTL